MTTQKSRSFKHTGKAIVSRMGDLFDRARALDMNQLVKHFIEGLLLLVPVVVTIYVVYFVFSAIDSWLNLPIPGIGFLITIGIIVLTGFLASHLAIKQLFEYAERLLIKAPFIKLLYSSIKDLLAAFMGEKKRFDKPVLVSLTPEGHIKAVGFVTRESVQFLGLEGYVAVYFPQSYNFAGNLFLFPRHQVRPIDLDSADAMAFLISGGVSGGSYSTALR